MKFFQLLFIFAAFPTFIFGIECAVSGVCYAHGFIGKNVFVLRKTCNDTCVYFKCIDSQTYEDHIFITEGAGCYEDFVNSCQYIPTKYKDEIQSNKKPYSIHNEVLIFKSCNDKDGCATNGFENWKADNSSDGIFGSLHSRKISEYTYVYSPLIDNSPLQCEKYIECRPANDYTVVYEYEYHERGDKKCDGCLHFKCTNDGGNTVISGGGCFEDFEYACPIVPSDVKEKIKANIKDSFYYDKNFIVASSSYYNIFYYSDLKNYALVNPKAEEIFQANLNKDYGEECHVEVSVFVFFSVIQIKSTPFYYPPQNAAAYGCHEILTIYLFAFIYFWLYI